MRREMRLLNDARATRNHFVYGGLATKKFASLRSLELGERLDGLRAHHGAFTARTLLKKYLVERSTRF